MKKRVMIDASSLGAFSHRSDEPPDPEPEANVRAGMQDARKHDEMRQPEVNPDVDVGDDLKPVEWVQAKKRIVRSRNLRVSTRPNLGSMLSDAYAVVASEMRAMRDQTAAGGQLDREQAKKFSLLGDTCVRLMREEREQALLHDPAEMDDTQLLEAVAEAKKLLGDPGDE